MTPSVLLVLPTRYRLALLCDGSAGSVKRSVELKDFGDADEMFKREDEKAAKKERGFGAKPHAGVCTGMHVAGGGRDKRMEGKLLRVGTRHGVMRWREGEVRRWPSRSATAEPSHALGCACRWGKGEGKKGGEEYAMFV